ncbi:MAG: 2-phosphosulfolactate phosphatase [Pseudomonadota bacterium]|nr:2-phosphosulfolactate phosphatase [Pseudomonadota bacterium]
MPKLHVLLKKEELDAARLEGKVVVVVDVLFATSTIVHALDAGAAAVWPATDREAAETLAAGMEGCLLAGEYMTDEIPGFAPATPLALAAAAPDGCSVVYCTTNGTVALARAAVASHVYVAALSNAEALASHVVQAHPGAGVLIVCAGSHDRFNLEDFYCAGHLVAHFRRLGDYDLTDAAIAAAMVRQACEPLVALSSSRVGRLMGRRGMSREVESAARADHSRTVPVLRDGRLRGVDA